jgi:hypothetical protein
MVQYRADEHEASVTAPGVTFNELFPPRLSVDRWRPSIHMPRWASRLTLAVTGVRVERVQEITAVDAIREGVRYEPVRSNWAGRTEDAIPSMRKAQAENRRRALAAFEDLWDSINGSRGYGWKANPWCWVLDFERVEEPT